MKYLLLLNLICFATLEAKSPVVSEPKKVEEKSTFNEKEFKERMQEWNDKIKALNEGKVPAEIFGLAEKIITLNSDMLIVLAEDLSAVITEKPNLVQAIRKQWQPVSNKPIFVGSSGETLYEMALRLSKDGNG